MERDPGRLSRLSELNDYKVVEGDPDPRGWEVVTRTGERVGRVDELIVDPDSERARYLEVRLERGAEHWHVLVPTSAVRIGEDERQRRQVEVGASGEYLASVTPYQGLPLTAQQEAEYQACPPAEPTGVEFGPTRISRGGMRRD